jgi:hypothetical protein
MSPTTRRFFFDVDKKVATPTLTLQDRAHNSLSVCNDHVHAHARIAAYTPLCAVIRKTQTWKNSPSFIHVIFLRGTASIRSTNI